MGFITAKGQQSSDSPWQRRRRRGGKAKDVVVPSATKGIPYLLTSWRGRDWEEVDASKQSVSLHLAQFAAPLRPETDWLTDWRRREWRRWREGNVLAATRTRAVDQMISGKRQGRLRSQSYVVVDSTGKEKGPIYCLRIWREFLRHVSPRSIWLEFLSCLFLFFPAFFIGTRI